MMSSLILLFVLFKGDAPSALEPLGKLDHRPIKEASGIVESRRFPGIFWVHNDSGNAPSLYAVKRDGTLVREYAVAIPNIDWEDIAIDDAGHLYIGEIGNNGTKLPLRVIYQVDEPDPSKASAGPLKVLKTSFYQFADKDSRFDAESLFIDRGRTLVISKHRDEKVAELFNVPFDPPGKLLSPVIPESLGKLPGFREPATGADLTPDGKRLAVCSYQVSRVYERGEGDTWKLVGTLRYPQEAIEAICWSGNDLILASESRRMFRISEKAWRLAPADDKAHPGRGKSPGK
ncbi:hypothetical protein [Singulisphaera sp. PoT]|uniref:hypothetical protein n=1 Tax=Singulisphaera sp. PoT TaxID=3411797 RepID=UPI003BF48FFC